MHFSGHRLGPAFDGEFDSVVVGVTWKGTYLDIGTSESASFSRTEEIGMS
jgi:hypothetical protein